MKNHRLKRYDKFGRLPRVEPVIHQPGEFKVYRRCPHRDGRTSLGWFAMCQGVGNFHHYQTQALACNRRYLEALAAVEDPTPAYDELRALTEPKHQHGRSYAGFNPAREADIRRFTAALAGDPVAQGFRNPDIRVAVFGHTPEQWQRQRHRAAVGRLLKRLPVRGLIAKVPHRRRRRVTALGRRILGDPLFTYGRYRAQAS